MINYDAIRQLHPLPPIVAAVVQLHRKGGEYWACCPFHPDKSPSFHILADRVRFHCFGCGASGDVVDFVRRLYRLGAADAVRAVRSADLPKVIIPTLPRREALDRVSHAKGIWRRAEPAAGTLAETYLAFRGITKEPPADIRFAWLPAWRSSSFPCLVAAVRDVSGEITGIHRIYLRSDGGGKAKLRNAKLSLGRIAGGAIRLGKPNGSRTIFVCEGLEDGLTLWQELEKPVWVSAGASMLPAMSFPAGVTSVVIGADNDDAGRQVAAKAAKTFASQGPSVRIVRPHEGFKDFNAELQRVRR